MTDFIDRVLDLIEEEDLYGLAPREFFSSLEEFLPTASKSDIRAAIWTLATRGKLLVTANMTVVPRND